MAASLWAGYTLALKRAGIGPWHAAALVNAYSVVGLVPVLLLGPPSRLLAAAFSALVPVLAALLGIPVLGEVPAPATVGGIAAIAAGVVLASGAVAPARARDRALRQAPAAF